jgi:hypothetical protein
MDSEAPAAALPDARAAEASLTPQEEKLRASLSDLVSRERRAYRRAVLIVVASFALGLGWLAYSFYRVARLNREYEQQSARLATTTEEIAEKQKALARIKFVLGECAQGRCDPQQVEEALEYANIGLNAGISVAVATATPTPQTTPTPVVAVPTPTPKAGAGGFDGPIYRGPAETTINVRVVPNKTAPVVVYSLNHGDFYRLDRDWVFSFKLPKNGGGPPSVLGMVLNFPSEDYCTVEVRASDGNKASYEVRGDSGVYFLFYAN